MIMNTKKFNLSILTEDAPFALFKRFGFQSGANADKFEGFSDYSRSANGLVYINKHTNAYLSLNVTGTADYGSHTMFTAELTENVALSDEPSVSYDYYQKFIKPKPKAAPEGGKTGYRCAICGYFHEGETLSPDFICPICKHGVADFIKEG
jgi:flavin reductase (DIM6/NTAB) family NADH-FMN oxidoreductase RutF